MPHPPTSSPASIFGFKGSESARRTEGYALVLVIAQRASVINNKGLWRTQGLRDASVVHATQVKDKTVISISKMWPLQLQLRLNNTNRVHARRCDSSLLALHERHIDTGYGVHAVHTFIFFFENVSLKKVKGSNNCMSKFNLPTYRTCDVSFFSHFGQK